MGAWGHESFANDDAADFVATLGDVSDLSLVAKAINELLAESDDYVPMDFAGAAIAACEVIARLKGNWGRRDTASEPVDRWVENHPQKVPSKLIRRALKAIDRILDDDSELRELWYEGQAGDDWKASVDDLRRRVAG
ncbi:DUF4259 domain-containing protein [Humisphaera borealis]|uniref:DUF4259 domain-containing protein n=1 Tax=Humisphaera borealis TaxID=2807512 RepID=A0A7M2WYA7_9BACT|nr:DUF4259 domain-containing protein [Humisphaera borealis]QOV90455.1 DUF4259 domain-containing protein [Humisphaera borealis]